MNEVRNLERFPYMNVLCDHRELGGDYRELSEWERTQRLTGSEWQCSKRPIQVKQVCLRSIVSHGNVICLFSLFINITVSSVLFLSVSICIVYSWGSSFISYIARKMVGERILEKSSFEQKYVVSVYINPTSFVPIYPLLFQTPNHPSIPYKYSVHLIGQSL